MNAVTTAIMTALPNLNKDTIRNSYYTLKGAIEKKFGSESDLVDALNRLEEKPNSEGRKTTVKEEIETVRANDDPELILLSQNLLAHLKERFGWQQNLHRRANVEPIFIEQFVKINFNQQEKFSWLLIFSLIGSVLLGFLVFREVRIKQYWEIVDTTEPSEYNPVRHQALENLNQMGISLSDASLSRANLSGIQLPNAKLENANFTSATLTGANLAKSLLEKASLRGAKLEKINLQGANLQQANLYRANLWGAYLEKANLQKAYLVRASLQENNLEEANLSEANLAGANLTKAGIAKANLTGANLVKGNLSGANLAEANLAGANLAGASLQENNLTNANLAGVNLAGANLRGAQLEGVSFWGANLEKANLLETKNLSSEQIKSSCNWQLATYKEEKVANQMFIEALKNNSSTNPKKSFDCTQWRAI
jgi:uncharacterized protein YjbI with pentapeptide repeats